MTPAFVVLTRKGFDLAQTLASVLEGAEIWGLESRVPDAPNLFANTGELLRDLFTQGRPIIGICASGILIRLLAPALDNKREEPAVIAIAEDGSAVVPLLGGHHGANTLARKIANHLVIPPAITTAGDNAFGIALDDPPAGWTLTNPRAAKDVTARLLAGETAWIDGIVPWLEALPHSKDGSIKIAVTPALALPDADLTYIAPQLALGVGCERDADPKEVIRLASAALEDANLSPKAVACVVSVDVKANEAAVHALAAHLGVPARFFPAGRLEEETPRLKNPSDIVFAEVGCHGVAEGAALAAAGPDASLIVEKQKSRRATCAIALSPAPLEASTIGTPQGRLSVVGIGPGSEEWRTPQVTTALRNATDVVGYGLYLDLISDLITGKGRHESGLANEEARARMALDIAAQGKDVCLVCSGDAGIYALATLVFELMDREDSPAWNRLDVQVMPGVSAIQGAAARIGAPINHDFCTISLSDLLTPWEDIQRRVRAAAEGDFVVAFYNPRSQKRVHQLEVARDLLLEKRPATTPVVLGRNLGRDDETIRVVELGNLSRDDADMLTLVLVGNSQSRHITRGVKEWVYTPRGYARKMPGGDKAGDTAQ